VSGVILIWEFGRRRKRGFFSRKHRL
jgi:hypothetical protein